MPFTPHDSEFDQFSTNYDKVNWIDNKTWASKKIYDSNEYWIVIPNQRFNLKLGNTRPILTVFLRKRGEQFGDPIVPLNIADLTVIFKAYDDSGNLVVIGNAVIADAAAGQIEYTFTPIDFIEPGRYFGEFDFTDGSSNVFTLPDNKIRLELFVIE